MKKIISKVSNQKAPIPLSVNYHFCRECNFNCGFCFHSKVGYEGDSLIPLMDLNSVTKAMEFLKENGCRKVNLTGGEPFLHQDFLGDVCKILKDHVGMESVSIVSNGSLLTEDWLDQYGEYVDIVGISIDSFNENTLEKIGRQKVDIFKIKEWLSNRNILLKINTVVNKLNSHEDLSEMIEELKPMRWKMFQCLTVPFENDRKAMEDYLISKEEFDEFVFRNSSEELKDIIIPESGEVLTDSYFILDEKLRFLDCISKKPGKSIIEEDNFEEILSQVNFNYKNFEERQGEFEWCSKKTINY